MRVSVIIPTYNHSNLLKYTLSSLTDQDFPTREYEVIVIDNGSSDDTRQVVESYKDKLNIKYHIQEDKEVKVTLARNEGIKRARGDLLVFIDTGIVVGNTFVRTHFNAHDVNEPDEKYAVIGYVYGFSYQHKDDDSTPEYIDFNRPNQMIQRLRQSQYYCDMRELVYSRINDDLNIIPVPWMLFYTNNASVKKAELIKVGCFDEDFVRWGVEDVECAYRLHKNKFKFKLSREACGVHYPHVWSIDACHASREMNMKLFYSKHQDDVVELLTTSNNYVFINDYINYLQYRGSQEKIPLYSSLLTKEAVKFISEEIPVEQAIIYGCQDGFLLDVFKSAAATESDADLLLKAKEGHSDIEIYRCIGICTPFRTNEYNASIIAGSGIVLTESFLNKLIFEAFRVSKKVYWLKLENGSNVTEYEYSEVKNLGNGVVLYEILNKIL